MSALLPARRPDAHKGTFGSLVVVAGSRRFVGAPVLSAAAAYRAGAGLVTLASPESTYRLAAPQLLEQVHLPLSETDEGNVSPNAASAVKAALEGASAGVIGPGLGGADSVRDFLQTLLLVEPALTKPVVLDPDALNPLATTSIGFLIFVS